jgi:hypothetical protein
VRVEKNIPNFKIPIKNVAKRLLEKRIVKKNLLFLGNSYYYPKECPDPGGKGKACIRYKGKREKHKR